MAEIAAEVTGQNNPGGNEQVDTTGSFSFADLHQKALDYTPEGTPEVTPQEQPAPVEAAPKTEVTEVPKVEEATKAELAQLKDTDLVEVIVDGQPVQMPWKDAKGGIMRQAKFTKDMTALRADQRQFEADRAAIAKLQEDHQVLVNLLRSKDLMREFIQRSYPDLVKGAAEAAQTAVAQATDSGDIATVGQIEAVAKQFEQNFGNLVQNLEKALGEREEALVQDIQDRNETLKLSTEINGTIKSMFDAHPHVAKLIPEAEQVLRYKVSQLEPKTPEEAVQAFKDVFGGWVEQFESAVTDTTKTKVVQKAKLASNNVQPPGGTSVQPTPTNFEKTNKLTGKKELDWSKLHEAALAYDGKK